MRRLAAILVLLCCVSASASSVVVVTFSFTNAAGTTNGQSLTVNVAIATASIATSGATAGAFKYVSCTGTTISSGSTYHLESDETSGGDQWYDNDTVLTSTGHITIIGHDVNETNGTDTNHSYVPVSFIYN